MENATQDGKSSAEEAGGDKPPDPRLAAFARLLARHAATQDFQKELRAKRNGANSWDPPSGNEPEDLP